jgi:hypothetical protein
MRHSLLDPCFFYEWIDYTPKPAIPDDPDIMLRYPDPDPPRHEDMGTKRVMCKDGVRKVCRVTKLDFTFVSGDYSKDCSELFAIDPGFCPFFRYRREATVAGVLGIDFLKRHRLVLDFSESPRSRRNRP